MSIFHPVNLAASLAFWPSLPIASDNWFSDTLTLAILVFSSTATFNTFAGLKAFEINSDMSLSHLIISIFSP